MNPPVERKYLTVADAATYSGLSEPTIKNAIAAGLVETYLVKATGEKGGRRLIKRESIDAWIEGKVAAITETPTPTA